MMQHSTSDVFIQIDENHANPSTPTKLGSGSVSQTTQSSVCISDKPFQTMCNALRRNIQPDNDDEVIRENMGYVWLAVNRALLNDPKMRPLANLEEFQQNVEQKGVQQFVNLLKDMADKDSWGDLLKNGISFLTVDLEGLITFCP